jgi:hypothetical protein
MRDKPIKQFSELHHMIFPPEKKNVYWDGTFNMPLEGLAHPLHKDCINLDFPGQER